MAGATILIVEDEAVIARDLQGLLEDRGYHVPAVAATAGDALAHLAQGGIDLVVVDICLADGREAPAMRRPMTSDARSGHRPSTGGARIYLWRTYLEHRQALRQVRPPHV